jgi:hypothetical protein
LQQLHLNVATEHPMKKFLLNIRAPVAPLLNGSSDRAFEKPRSMYAFFRMMLKKHWLLMAVRLSISDCWGCCTSQSDCPLESKLPSIKHLIRLHLDFVVSKVLRDGIYGRIVCSDR